MNMINNPPKVAIILVNYNGDEDTLECIKSLETIQYDNKEVFVIDNASSEPTKLEESLKKFSWVHFIQLEKNIGFAGGNNVGIQHALQKGVDAVLLLNNDTVVKKDFLNRMVEVWNNDESIGVVTGKILYFADQDKTWFAGGSINLNKAKIQHLNANRKDTQENIVKNITFATGCLMLIPCKVLEKVGALDEDYFMYTEDADYCCRIQKAGYRIVYTSYSVIYHKVSASTGGRGSKFSQYYRTRNDLLLLRRYAPNRPSAYFFYGLRLFKRLLNGQFQMKYVIKGLKDYTDGILGQIDADALH